MAVDSLNQSDGWNCAREALAEIRVCNGGLQTFLDGAFDQLDHLADDLLAQELACQRGEREALQAQVDRLALVANELTAAVAEQKLLGGQKRKRSDREQGEASSDA
jgi:hypothetical protein